MTNPNLQPQTTSLQAVEQPSLRDLFHTLWFRRRLLFSTALFIIALGIIVLFQMVPRYTASSSILIGVPKTKVVDIEQVLSAGLGTDAAILSEVEVMRSRGLAARVIQKLRLLSKEEFNPEMQSPGLLSHLNPANWIPEELKESLGFGAPVISEEEIERLQMAAATDAFLKKLKVSPVKRSNVIKISFESLDPRLAAAVANELPESYIIDQMEAKLEATEKATKWLDGQLTDLKEKVERSEKAVEAYREEHELTEIQGDRILEAQLSEINKQLIFSKAERAQAEARLQQVRRVQDKQGSGESVKEVLSSMTIQRLREQEAIETREASMLSLKFKSSHKTVKEAKARIRDIKKQINLEIGRIITGLENDVEVAQIKELSLAKGLRELEKKSSEQTTEAIRLRALEREASANRTLFETFLNRFKETSTTSGITEADARVISSAEIPAAASFPKKKLMLILIVIGAFFTAIILVFLVQALNQGILSPEQIENELGLAAIGLIPLVEGSKPYDYLIEKPHSGYAEALNTLKTALILSSPDNALKSMQITSSVPQEGKSSLALSFARLLAKSGHKVILIDGDLRLASLEKKLGIPPASMGLTDLVMATEGSIDEFVIRDEKSGAFIMPKGAAEFINATDIFSSHRMETIIENLKESFDYIIIDTPPVMAVSDARIIGRLVDKTVFVVRWDKTPRKVVKAAVQLLKESGADIAGAVLQQVNLQRYGTYGYGDSGYYYHYGQYGDYYSSDAKPSTDFIENPIAALKNLYRRYVLRKEESTS